MGKLWTPQQLKMVAVDYQQGLLDRLNEEIKGTEYENKSIVNTVIESALKREQSLIFNYASQALNNSFFLDSLIPTGEHTMRRMSVVFQRHLDREYGSVHQFISYMSAAAMGMVGSGWVWLVIDRQNRLATVATYGAGTMLIRERQQANPLGGGTNMPLIGGEGVNEIQGAGAPATQEAPARQDQNSYLTPRLQLAQQDLTIDANNFRFFGQNLNPIMCISVHEHAWLHDYGVWGKEEYLKQFWTVLDWDKVSKHHERWAEMNLNDPANKPAGR